MCRDIYCLCLPLAVLAFRVSDSSCGWAATPPWMLEPAWVMCRRNQRSVISHDMNPKACAGKKKVRLRCRSMQRSAGYVMDGHCLGSRTLGIHLGEFQLAVCWVQNCLFDDPVPSRVCLVVARKADGVRNPGLRVRCSSFVETRLK